MKWVVCVGATLLAALATMGTAAPTSVTVAGDFQSEAGCTGDWDPTCAVTHLNYNTEDAIWQGIFTVPAGTWHYKIAIDDSWAENYGANATPNGANMIFTVGATTAVKFYYDPVTHWATDSTKVVATVPGSFQSEAGCGGDWDPSCLKSLLEDADGDGTFTLTLNLAPGSYDAKVAIGESWTENYGAGGAAGGSNIPFSVTGTGNTLFTYDSSTHVLTIDAPVPVTLSRWETD
jgi:hypothetical protein